MGLRVADRMLSAGSFRISDIDEAPINSTSSVPACSAAANVEKLDGCPSPSEGGVTPDPLMAMTFENSPFANAEARNALTLLAPAETPAKVTLDASPPKDPIFV